MFAEQYTICLNPRFPVPEISWAAPFSRKGSNMVVSLVIGGMLTQQLRWLNVDIHVRVDWSCCWWKGSISIGFVTCESNITS